MDVLRTFVAIELSENLKAALKRAQRELRALDGAGSVRWVAAENIHLTLKFLGEIESTRVSDFALAIRKTALKFGPFRLTVGTLGCFPSPRRPNLIWAGVVGDVDQVTRLAQAIDDACAPLGIAREERPFSPHLTLGRVKREARPADRAAIGQAIQTIPFDDLGVIEPEEVILFESQLRPEGPVYSILARAPLHTR